MLMPKDEVFETNDQTGDAKSPPQLIENVDYYVENGLFVFTREFLLKRGYCCESGCRNCPYPHEVHEKGRS